MWLIIPIMNLSNKYMWYLQISQLLFSEKCELFLGNCVRIWWQILLEQFWLIHVCIFQIWHRLSVLLQPVNMRGVAQSQKQVSASSSPRYTYQDLFKSHGGHGLFDDVDIGKLKKSTTKGVKTESFTSDGYVFQFLNYGQVCSDKPIAVVGLTINTCLSDDSGNSYIYTCNPSK